MRNETLKISSYPVQLFGNDDAKVIVFLLSEKEITKEFKDYLENHDLLLCNLIIENWFSSLSPWEEKLPGFPLFEGKGEETFRFFERTLFPLMKKRFGFDKAILAGYSLAGLFSLYAGTKTEMFDAIASISGSLWYPGFLSYLKKNPIRCKNIYLSIGEKESNSKSKILQTGLSCQLQTFSLFNSEKKNVLFQINPGGHFIDCEKRTIKGIDFLFEELRKEKNNNCFL